MGKVESIESQIKELSSEELTALREWFLNFDAEAWDRQFEADVKAGKLDGLAERALRDVGVVVTRRRTNPARQARAGGGIFCPASSLRRRWRIAETARLERVDGVVETAGVHP